jgi:hypothetical protein
MMYTILNTMYAVNPDIEDCKVPLGPTRGAEQHATLKE